MYTGFNPLGQSTVLRRKKDGTRVSVTCPTAIEAYNKFMGGVDHGDQLRGYYHRKFKSRKFYKYIFYFLLEVSVTNAFILYRESHPHSKIAILELLGLQLIGEYCGRRRAGRIGHQIVPLPLRHFPTKVPCNNFERKRGRCSLCKEKHKHNDTQWYCKECGVWLCHPGTTEDCFLLWHKRM